MSEDIRSIRNMNHLIRYFANVLNWDIDTDSFDPEEVSYDFSASDLGIKEDAFAKIRSLKQLPPLVEDQPWGIFSVEFDSHKFEVTALRKVLSGLIPKQRNATNHAVWDKDDLLFLCFWGEDNNRTIGIAHFEDKDIGLPQIKMVYCSPAIEDTSVIQDFVVKIGNLAWPIEVHNHKKWHDDWSKAFTITYKQTIRDSETLTKQLATEAIAIRDRIMRTLEIETEDGYVHLLYQKFKETLVHDMTEKQFADMYAQTVVYGLFSARCMDKTQDDFSADEAVSCIPNTNPFLKNLMRECFGAERNSKLSFDELEIGNVVELLRHTKTDDIINDFNRQTGRGKEDTVIHFYEKFLEAYDKTQKVDRGVFYTPQPVVNFIVKAVDAILKKDFGHIDGFASTETKTIKGLRHSRKAGDYDRMIEDSIIVPAVQILDPATGTGTFLRQTIIQIYENFKAVNNGCSEEELHQRWNQYVPKHLLPRINAFELMMAPYAVAHMKLALILKDTGYDFENDERLNVYLTNSLEKPGNSDKQIGMFDDPLASEAISSNGVKKNNGINIVMGNPPYSISSSNKSEWILDLLSDYKKGLNEKKVNLDDDYIKFIRYGQYIVQKSGRGILAYITNNSFLDGITHREMRRQLLELFNKIYVVNLHGNSKRKECAPDGGKDENVFDIQQGVCIFIGVLSAGEKQGIYSYDLYGTQESKYDFLRKNHLDELCFNKLNPISPNYFFTPKDFSNSDTYNEGFSIPDLFIEYNSGIQTKRDKLVISYTEDRVKSVVSDFSALGVEELRDKYELPPDGRDWTIEGAKKDISAHDKTITKILYRPFDYRYTAYTGYSKGFMAYPREKVFKHFVGHNNIGLLVRRNTPPVDFTHVFVCDGLISEGVLGIDPNGREYVFPLYLYPEEGSINSRIDNMNGEVKNRLAKSIGVDTMSAFDVFCYIYAYLHSNKYREEYSEFLKIDFPRIPYPKTKETFYKLADLGRRLIDCHLLKDTVSLSDISFDANDVNSVDNPKFIEGRIYINRTQYFEHVSEKAWNTFIGGYAPLQKWLKLRKGRNLTAQEVDEYKHIICSITETERLMDQIDIEVDL